MFKQILKAKINIGHLLLISLIYCLVSICIMAFVQLLFWFLVRDGEYPRWWNYLFLGLWILTPFLILFPIIYFRVKYHFNKMNYSKSKNLVYVVVLVVLTSVISAFYLMG